MIFFLGQVTKAVRFMSSLVTSLDVYAFCSLPCREATGHFGKVWRGVSLKYNQHDATFSRSIYFYNLLYMFQAVPPPIIRSTQLYIQRQVLSNQYCCLLLSWMRWNVSSILSTIAASSSIGLTIPDAVCTVVCSWWWAEEPPKTRTASLETNK